MPLKTLAIIGGLVAVVGGGIWAARDNFAERSTSDDVAWVAPARSEEIRALSSDAARNARAAHYQEFATLAQTRALPSYFARKEALYALAGRADAGALRALISEANRIDDQGERLESLEILLTRYVEIDPKDALRSALNMDRTASSQLVPVVIGAWSRTDLAAAAVASRELPTRVLQTTAAHAILVRHASGDVQQVRQLAKDLGVPEQADSVLFEARAGTVLADPHQSLQAALARGASQKEVAEIAGAWGRIAPEEAWDYASQLTDPATRLVFQESVVDAWAADQPAAAFARIMELPPDWQRSRLLRKVTLELAQKDPRQAVALIEEATVQERDDLQNTVAIEWARMDPTNAAEWVEAQGRGSLSRLAYQIAAPYVTQKPDEALAWALRVSRSPGKNLWSHMVGIMAEQDPDAALQLALSAETAARKSQALNAVIRTLAARDPALAMSHVDKLPPGQMRVQALTQIGVRLAEASPERSLEWLKGIEDPQSRRQVAQSVVNQIALRDDAAAVRLLDRVPEDLRSGWIRGVGNAYAESGDLEKGAQWIRRFQDDPVYTSLVANVTGRFNQQQDTEVLFDLIAKVPNARRRDQMLGQTLVSMAMSTPENAVKGIDRIADDTQRARTTAQIVSAWATRDYAEARKWALSLDESKGREQAIGQLVGNQRTSLDEALSLIGQMRTPDARAGAVMSKARQLARTNPEESRTLLRRYPLDPARQRQLDRMLENNPNYEEDGWYAGD